MLLPPSCNRWAGPGRHCRACDTRAHTAQAYSHKAQADGDCVADVGQSLIRHALWAKQLLCRARNDDADAGQQQQGAAGLVQRGIELLDAVLHAAKQEAAACRAWSRCPPQLSANRAWKSWTQCLTVPNRNSSLQGRARRWQGACAAGCRMPRSGMPHRRQQRPSIRASTTQHKWSKDSSLKGSTQKQHPKQAERKVTACRAGIEHPQHGVPTARRAAVLDSAEALCHPTFTRSEPHLEMLLGVGME